MATDAPYVLIIASNGDAARELRESCARSGVAARCSPDPLHGIMQATLEKPRMILIDAQDDWPPPLTLTEVIRQFESLASIPVVVIGTPGSDSIDSRILAPALLALQRLDTSPRMSA